LGTEREIGRERKKETSLQRQKEKETDIQRQRERKTHKYKDRKKIQEDVKVWEEREIKKEEERE
jgi:hypothetical protein